MLSPPELRHNHRVSETVTEDVLRSNCGCNDFGWRTIGSPTRQS